MLFSSDELLNLTPHDVNVILENGDTVQYKPCGTVARANADEQDLLYTLPKGSVPVYSVPHYTGVTPADPRESKAWTSSVKGVIVSEITARAIMALDYSEQSVWGEVYSPDAGVGVKRDAKGGIIGVRGLCRW